jgi:hypothetical protein
VTNMPKNGQDWPLVTNMVANNQRLLVFTSIRSKEQSEGIAYQWNYMVENQCKKRSLFIFSHHHVIFLSQILSSRDGTKNLTLEGQTALNFFFLFFLRENSTYNSLSFIIFAIMTSNFKKYRFRLSIFQFSPSIRIFC